jgi:hypothetical protein
MWRYSFALETRRLLSRLLSLHSALFVWLDYPLSYWPVRHSGCPSECHSALYTLTIPDTRQGSFGLQIDMLEPQSERSSWTNHNPLFSCVCFLVLGASLESSLSLLCTQVWQRALSLETHLSQCCQLSVRPTL